MSSIDTEEYGQDVIIKVVGIGGAGGLALESMIKAKIQGVDFIAANTDVQALKGSSAPTKIQLGVIATQGLGAGSDPDKGSAAAQEALTQIGDTLTGADMVILVAGMGGGTGSGATQVIADAARVLGAFTIGLVTLPFANEGERRMAMSKDAICELGKRVDSLIIIPNDCLCAVGTPTKDLFEIFKAGDAILTEAVRGITDILTRQGIIGIDFADVRHVLTSDTPVMLGIAEESGNDRARNAIQKALRPFSQVDVDISQARSVLVNITGSSDISMDDYNDISRDIHSAVCDTATIIISIFMDDWMEETLKVTAYFSGFESPTTAKVVDLSNIRRIRAAQDNSTRIRPLVNFIEDEDRYDL